MKNVVEKNTRYILLSLLLATAFLYYDGMQWSFHTPRYLLLQTAAAVLIILIFLKKELSIDFCRLDLIILIFLSFIVVHSLLMSGGGDLFNRLDVLISMGVVYFAFQTLSRPGLKIVTKYTVLILNCSGFLLSVYGLLQFHGCDPLREGLYPAAESRVIGSMGNANDLAGYLAAVFPFMIAMQSNSLPRIGKWCTITGSGVILSAIALSLSRGVWLAMSAGCIYYLYPKLSSKWRYLKTTHISWVIISILLLFGVCSTWALYKQNPESARGRLMIWQITFRMIAQNPLTGVGYGQFGRAYLSEQAEFLSDPSHEKWVDWADNLKGAKNEYLQTIAELGPMGALLLLLLVVALVKAVVAVNRKFGDDETVTSHVRVFSTSALIISVHGLVDNPFYVPATTLLLLYDMAVISLLNKFCLSQEKPVFTPTNSQVRLQINFHPHYLIRILIVICAIIVCFRVYHQGFAYIDWKKGQEYSSQRKWDKAIELYEKARDRIGNDGELLFHLAAAYTYSRQADKALPLLENSLLRFNDKNLYIVRGYAFIQTGQIKEAETSFLTAISMYPKLLLPRLWLAKLYIMQSRYREAEQKLQEIIAIHLRFENEEINNIKKEAQQMLQNYPFK